MLQAIPHDRDKLAHLASAIFALKQPLRRARADLDAAAGAEEFKMVSADLRKVRADTEAQLEPYQSLFAEAEARRARTEDALQKDRDQWKDKAQWEAAKAKVSQILAQYKAELEAAIPGARIKFRGSLASGWKGPHKVDKETGAARRFNPREFDCDAFVEVPAELWKRELLDTRLLSADQPWAKVQHIAVWPRAAAVRKVSSDIKTQLRGIEGYQSEDGEPHFQLTLQVDTESLRAVLQGNTYPKGSLSAAGAPTVEEALPINRVRDTGKTGVQMPEVIEVI